MSEKQLQAIKAEVSPFITKASDFVVDSPVAMNAAVELLSVANKNLDKIKEEEEKVTKPLNEALKAERGRWKPMKDMLSTVIDKLRTNIGAYQTEQDRIAKAAEAKLAERMAKGTLKPETAVAKMGAITRPEEKVATMAGSVSFRETQVLKILSETAIPRQYLMVDEKKLMTALKAGIKVPGAEIETVKSVVNRR